MADRKIYFFGGILPGILMSIYFSYVNLTKTTPSGFMNNQKDLHRWKFYRYGGLDQVWLGTT